jgi:uncharacterized membrane protein (UPF0127 family)
MVVVNETKNTILSDRCRFANSPWKRLIGLLNRKVVVEGEGLLLDRCYGIHTFGMRFTIDVVYLDTDFRVLRIIKELPPFRACVLKKPVFVMELPAGTLDRTRTTEGDQIHILVSNNRPNHILVSNNRPDAK